jgi:hypothetical protein
MTGSHPTRRRRNLRVVHQKWTRHGEAGDTYVLTTYRVCAMLKEKRRFGHGLLFGTEYVVRRLTTVRRWVDKKPLIHNGGKP